MSFSASADFFIMKLSSSCAALFFNGLSTFREAMIDHTVLSGVDAGLAWLPCLRGGQETPRSRELLQDLVSTYEDT